MKTNQWAFCLASLLCSQGYSQNQNVLLPEVHGYLDFYSQQSPQDKYLAGRAFDRHTGKLVLNMAELSFQTKKEKLLFKTSLGFGEMVDQLSGGSSESQANPAANESTRHLTQATLTYAASEKVAVTVGKFYTHMGLEVAKAKDNWQYSRSYTYNYGLPFWHQGLSVSSIIVPEKLSATLYVLNSWDGRLSQEQNRHLSLGANINWSENGRWIVNYNYLGGAESADHGQRQVHEINMTYQVTPSTAVAFDGIYGIQKNSDAGADGSWKGLVLMAKYTPNDFYTLSPRVEFFDDADQGSAVTGGFTSLGVSQKITSITVTNSFQLEEGLETWVEIRSDSSDSEQFFKDRDGNATSTQQSLALALLYSF